MPVAPVVLAGSVAGSPGVGWCAVSKSLIRCASYLQLSGDPGRQTASGSGRYREEMTDGSTKAGAADDDFDAVEFERAERAEREERAATRKLAGIEAGRRKGGLAGAAMAGAMLAAQEIYEGPPHDADIVEVAESPDEPGDIDTDGIEVNVDGVDVWAPPPLGAPDPSET